MQQETLLIHFKLQDYIGKMSMTKAKGITKELFHTFDQFYYLFPKKEEKTCQKYRKIQ